MRVLLTGASGFVGSNVAKYFFDNTDWEVVATCSDLTNEVPDMGEFDVILHLASLSSVEQSIKDPVRCFHNNLDVTINMLEYARKRPPKMFINFSTTGIYTGGKDNDWGSVLPTNPYIASKIAQEAIATSYYRTYDVPVVIVSSTNIVGPNQGANSFVPKIIKSILNDEEISLYKTKDAEFGSRIYNPVVNVADALMFIIDNLKLDKHQDRPGRYTIGGGKCLNNMEMAEYIADIAGKPVKYRIVEADTVRHGYDQHYDHADGKLEKLGWKPKITLEEGLRELLSGDER